MPKKGQIKDISNQKFGRLTAIEHVGFTKHRNAIWKCLCDCGNTTNVAQTHLKNTNGTRSCGCLRLERLHKAKAIQAGEAGFNYLYRQYVSGAGKRKLDFCLSKKDFKILVQQKCTYCGTKPNNKIKNPGCKSGHSEFTYNGVDRVDSSIGYTIDNCVTACKSCNFAKGKMSPSEFVSLAKKIVKYQKSIKK